MRRRPLLALFVIMTLAGCTDAGTPEGDEDGDGVKDSVEREGRVVTIHLLEGPVQRHITSDPEKVDTDGDGLTDADELLLRGTDPRDVDTDDDGLLDGDDLAAPDDETADAWRRMGIVEVGGIFLGELDACEDGGYQLKPDVASSDLPLPDELADGEEIRGWDIFVSSALRHVTSDPCAGDTDGDGLADHDEKRLLSDPRLADTDNDGARDSSDADPTGDLALAFGDAYANATNATSVRLVFAVAQSVAHLTTPGNHTATLDVPDTSATRDSLEMSVIVTAEDASGAPLALFEDPRGVIVTFDLIRGSVSGARADEDDGARLLFGGDDGSVSFRWETVRR